MSNQGNDEERARCEVCGRPAKHGGIVTLTGFRHYQCDEYARDQVRAVRIIRRIGDFEKEHKLPPVNLEGEGVRI